MSDPPIVMSATTGGGFDLPWWIALPLFAVLASVVYWIRTRGEGNGTSTPAYRIFSAVSGTIVTIGLLVYLVVHDLPAKSPIFFAVVCVVLLGSQGYNLWAAKTRHWPFSGYDLPDLGGS